jgi:hypothetical protein
LYDVPVPSEKVLAWIGLGNALGKVAGPRFASLALKRRNARKNTIEGRRPGGPVPVPAPVTAAAPPPRPATPQPNAAMFETAPSIAEF